MILAKMFSGMLSSVLSHLNVSKLSRRFTLLKGARLGVRVQALVEWQGSG